MRVVLHGMADDISDLVETAVVFFLERMKNASLNGLESVINMRDSTFKNDVAGIVEKPVSIHALEGLLGLRCVFRHEENGLA